MSEKVTHTNIMPPRHAKLDTRHARHANHGSIHIYVEVFRNIFYSYLQKK